MKKTILFVSLFALAFPALYASTCETRVDAHQCATTRERVNYCLNQPEAAAQLKDDTTLIYENVIVQTPEQTESKTTPLKQKYYSDEELEVGRTYVPTEQFPAFKNDILSEQELKALQKQQATAHKQPQEISMTEVLLQESAQRPARQMKGATAAAAEPKQPKKKTKPGRIMRVVVEEETVTTQETVDTDIIDQTPAPTPDVTPVTNTAAEPADQDLYPLDPMVQE